MAPHTHTPPPLTHTHTNTPTDIPEGPISKPCRLSAIPSSLCFGFLLQNVGVKFHQVSYESGSLKTVTTEQQISSS